MAFSGYPDGKQALREMRRVLAEEGRLVMVDVNFPADGNIAGRMLAKFWKASGDLIRDVPQAFEDIGWNCDDQEVGGYGSVHLYLAKK
jgi:ubiquinone/menaquinone biosynthesis C-methylase UbiE